MNPTHVATNPFLRMPVTWAVWITILPIDRGRAGLARITKEICELNDLRTPGVTGSCDRRRAALCRSHKILLPYGRGLTAAERARRKQVRSAGRLRNYGRRVGPQEKIRLST